MLSANDKTLISSTWNKVAANAEDIGAEALERLFLAHPQTKIYFSHMDLSPGSSMLRAHGKKVMGTIEGSIKSIDKLATVLSRLSDMHAYNFMVDPVNFKLLSQCILVALATQLMADFTPEAQCAWDKFLALISEILFSKYR
ncbi:hemoglobin subunit alpha-D [Latimeria chalumnae]|uniref:Hemoglobin subunit zeta n=1 Tax=Latimeria chalumnae TaxID=7897 RepID=H3ABR1_LATCH|nr:PREDICTED: hemoglobin subunit zeta [Latimeria chalumnae]|eukprot:XP_006011107.1 PREDICTED: hemoglobin subunit zeta [Latimeria chalumnae]